MLCKGPLVGKCLRIACGFVCMRVLSEDLLAVGAPCWRALSMDLLKE